MKPKNLIIKTASLKWGDQLILALRLLGGKRSPYRVPVVDEKFIVKGVISGRRILEVLVGRRGEALRAKKEIKNIFMEPVYLFLDEAHNIFPETTGLDIILQYMAENTLGYVFIVDHGGVLQGMVNEASILRELKGRVFGMNVREAMRVEVYSTAAEASILDASVMMADRQIRRVPVVEDGILVGVITATDILHHVLAHSDNIDLIPNDMAVADVLTEKVKDIMSKPISIEPNQDIGEAIDKIVGNEISGLPVVSEERKLVGIISRIDLITIPVRTRGVTYLANMMGV